MQTSRHLKNWTSSPLRIDKYCCENSARFEIVELPFASEPNKLVRVLQS